MKVGEGEKYGEELPLTRASPNGACPPYVRSHICGRVRLIYVPYIRRRMCTYVSLLGVLNQSGGLVVEGKQSCPLNKSQ